MASKFRIVTCWNDETDDQMVVTLWRGETLIQDHYDVLNDSDTSLEELFKAEFKKFKISLDDVDVVREDR